MVWSPSWTSSMCPSGQLDGIVSGPKLDGVEHKCIEQRGEHIDRNHDHSEEDKFFHPLVIDLTATLNIAVPVVHVPRHVKWPIAGSDRHQQTDQHKTDRDPTRQRSALHRPSPFVRRAEPLEDVMRAATRSDRKSTRLNSSHVRISY